MLSKNLKKVCSSFYKKFAAHISKNKMFSIQFAAFIHIFLFQDIAFKKQKLVSGFF